MFNGLLESDPKTDPNRDLFDPLKNDFLSYVLTCSAPIFKSICLRLTTRYSSSVYKGIAISLKRLIGGCKSSLGALAFSFPNPQPPFDLSFSCTRIILVQEKFLLFALCRI